jgi:serine phosphatase RsbU (regulator of sigma subunit)/DNA-binding response OmpR family regulator
MTDFVEENVKSRATAVDGEERPLRVLVLEDSEDDALLLVRELRRQGFIPDWLRIDNARDMRRALESSWDLIVADYSMPGFTALEALALRDAEGVETPFLIVSGAITDETAVEAMRAGAHDYIMKDNLSRLGPAVERELRDAEERLRRRQAEESVDGVLRLALERERNLERLNRLVDISGRILAQSTLEGLLQAVVDGARELTDAEVAVVGHGRAQVGLPGPVVSRAEGLSACPERPFEPDRGGVYLEVIEQGRPVRLGADDLPDHPAWWGLPSDHIPLEGLLAVPLWTDGRGPGAVLMVSRSRQRDFTPEDENLLQQLANLTSLGLRQMEARHEAEGRAAAEQKHRELSDALNEINLLVGSSMRDEDILPGVMAAAVRVLGSSSASLSFADDGRWVIRAVEGLPLRLVGRAITAERSPVVEQVVKSGEIVWVQDVRSDPRISPQSLIRSDTRGFLAAPLQSEALVKGVLCFDFTQARVLSEVEIDFVRKLAASLSLALENSRLYRAERRIADALQESLLVVPERLPSVRFGHLYRSATEAAKVGGDFYDLFELEDGRVVFTIGDVSGHGVEGASVASFLRSLVRGYAAEERSPATILAKLNRTLIHAQGYDNFATVFLGVLDPQHGRLDYCSAGHPPPFLLTGAGEVQTLSSASSVVGAFLDAEYRSGEAHFDHSAILLLYTDGLVEARRGREFFGEDRLYALLAQAPRLGPERLPDYVFSSVSDFTQGLFRDDVAILAVGLDSEAG